MRRIQDRETYKINKISLSCFDDKKFGWLAEVLASME